MTMDPNIDEQWHTDGPQKGVRVRLPIAIAVIAVVALVGIWGGAQLKGNKASASVTSTAGQGQGGRGNPFRGYGGPGAGNGQGRGAGAVGTVQAVNGNSITIIDNQGQTRTVTIGPDTTITKTTTGALSDITTGQMVVVRQTTNSNGTTTVQAITVGNGALGGFGGFGGGGANGANGGNGGNGGGSQSSGNSSTGN